MTTRALLRRSLPKPSYIASAKTVGCQMPTVQDEAQFDSGVFEPPLLTCVAPRILILGTTRQDGLALDQQPQPGTKKRGNQQNPDDVPVQPEGQNAAEEEQG